MGSIEVSTHRQASALVSYASTLLSACHPMALLLSTLHPEPCTLNPELCTLNPGLYTLNATVA